MTNAVSEIETETPPMRTSMVSVHQRSPGQMETHWEENNGPSRYFNKHPAPRSVNLYLCIPFETINYSCSKVVGDYTADLLNSCDYESVFEECVISILFSGNYYPTFIVVRTRQYFIAI